MSKLDEYVGFSELGAANIWKALAAEFVGNVLLNFFGCASIVHLEKSVIVESSLMVVPIAALAFGFTIFILVQTLGHVSGGHINPAVTSGMLVTGNVRIIRGVLYIIVQCLGSLAGSGILKVLTPDPFESKGLGNTLVNRAADVHPIQGLGVEFLLGFVLVLTVFGVCDPKRPESKPAGPLAIGIAVSVGHLATIDYTGSSMNPARSFGAAVVANNYEDHWVYWVGPILGGIFAALLYKYVFAATDSDYAAVEGDPKELKKLNA